MIALVLFGIPATLFILASVRQCFADDEVHWKEGMV